MDSILDIYFALRSFLERGGDVLLVIVGVIFAMWTLILSRWVYLSSDYRWDVAPILERWTARSEDNEVDAQRRRVAALLSIQRRLDAGIPVIRVLASVCPLLGLLGTVTGMIFIFDVLALVGSSSTRAIAGGVSMALVTTMAGMVGALSGIFPAAVLSARARMRLTALKRETKEAQHPPLAPRGRWRRAIRYVASPMGGVVMTLLLLFAMEQTIVFGRAVLEEPIRRFEIDMLRVRRDTEVRIDESLPQRPSEASAEPEFRLERTPSEAAGMSGLAVAAPRADLNLKGGLNVSDLGGVPSLSDGDIQPLVSVEPIYPARAAARRLEGWVLVSLTVTPSGSVKDVQAVQSSHEIFEAAAVAAAEKFKFRPRIIDGVPVEVTGVLNRILFRLQQ
jgi:biopolymer transport protein ExbB